MKLGNILLILFALFSFSCGSLKVDTDYDTKYDYAGLSKYAWLDIDENEEGNVLIGMPDVYERARIAVNRALNEKGYKLAVNEEPDFYIDVYLGIEEITDIVDNRPAGRGTRGNDLDFTENFLREGTLIIDIIAPDETYVIWRGVGMDEVSDPDEYEKKEAKQQRVDHIVYQILKEFPPETD